MLVELIVIDLAFDLDPEVTVVDPEVMVRSQSIVRKSHDFLYPTIHKKIHVIPVMHV